MYATRRARWLVGLASLLLATAGPMFALGTPASAARAAPELTVTGQVACSQLTLQAMDLNWTVSQQSDYPARFVAESATPDDVLYGPGADPVLRGSPWLVRQLMRPDLAALGGFVATMSVTVDFDIPEGPVRVTGHGSVTLPLCPAQMNYWDAAYEPKCDGSVTVTVTYAPGFTAAPTSVSVVGRGYAFDSPSQRWDLRLVTGDTKTVVVPEQYGYVIDAAQEGGLEHLASGSNRVLPAGCPPRSSGPPPGQPPGGPPPPGGAAGSPPSTSDGGSTQSTGPQNTGGPGAANGPTPGGAADPSQTAAAGHGREPPVEVRGYAATSAPGSGFRPWAAVLAVVIAVVIAGGGAGFLLYRRNRRAHLTAPGEAPTGPA